MKAKKILKNGKSIELSTAEKLVKLYSSEYYSLSGILKNLRLIESKEQGKISTLFFTLIEEHGLQESKVNSKNLSYFLTVENADKKEFNIKGVISLLSRMASFNKGNKSVINKTFCRRFQLAADKTRLIKNINAASEASEQLKEKLAEYAGVLAENPAAEIDGANINVIIHKASELLARADKALANYSSWLAIADTELDAINTAVVTPQ